MASSNIKRVTGILTPKSRFFVDFRHSSDMIFHYGESGEKIKFTNVSFPKICRFLDKKLTFCQIG